MWMTKNNIMDDENERWFWSADGCRIAFEMDLQCCHAAVLLSCSDAELLPNHLRGVPSRVLTLQAQVRVKAWVLSPESESSPKSLISRDEFHLEIPYVIDLRWIRSPSCYAILHLNFPPPTKLKTLVPPIKKKLYSCHELLRRSRL